MEKLTFKRQLFFGIVLIIAGNILAFTFRKGIFSNIAWILYGLLFIINPVYPEQRKKSKSSGKSCRNNLCRRWTDHSIYSMTFFIGDGDASCWHGILIYFFACDQELGEIGGIL